VHHAVRCCIGVLTTLHFDPNLGQAPAPVRYVARTSDYSLYLFDKGIDIRVPYYGRVRYSEVYKFGDHSYTGLTPGFPGLYQMNVQLRDNLAAGDVQLYLSSGNCYPLLARVPNAAESNIVMLPIQ